MQYILRGGGGIGVMTLDLKKLQHQKVILRVSCHNSVNIK